MKDNMIIKKRSVPNFKLSIRPPKIPQVDNIYLKANDQGIVGKYLAKVSGNTGERSTRTSGFFSSTPGKAFIQTKSESTPLFLKTIYQNSQNESGSSTYRPVKPTQISSEESKTEEKIRKLMDQFENDRLLLQVKPTRRSQSKTKSLDTASSMTTMNKIDKFRKSGSRRSIVIGDTLGNDKRGKILIDPTRVINVGVSTPRNEEAPKHKRAKSN